MQRMKKLFIDGAHGTTGLELRRHIEEDPDYGKVFQLITIPKEQRHNRTTRMKCIQEADLVILCLPDDEARSIVLRIEAQIQAKIKAFKPSKGSKLPAPVQILDTSSAHRCTHGWEYGLREISGQEAKIRQSQRVSNPGCYALAFIAALRPLIEMGILSRHTPINVHGISGYSGGGRSLIATVESDHTRFQAHGYLPYSLDLAHKHCQEMKQYTGLAEAPVFQPAVIPVYRGMLVQIPLHHKILAEQNISSSDILACLQDYYKHYEDSITVRSLEEMLQYPEQLFAEKFLTPPFTHKVGANSRKLEILVAAGMNGDVMLHSMLDNLDKGAAGTALANLKLMLAE